MRNNRVVVLFDDFEIAELLIRAGEVPLSKWIRKRVLEGRLTTLSAADGPTVVYVDRENPAAVKFENKMREHYKSDIPRGEELAAGEASARSKDASGEIASRRLPKAAKPQKSMPVELPDTTLCQHNMFKSSCPRCSSRI
jgi:hypothetical protein